MRTLSRIAAAIGLLVIPAGAFAQQNAPRHAIDAHVEKAAEGESEDEESCREQRIHGSQCSRSRRLLQEWILIYRRGAEARSFDVLSRCLGWPRVFRGWVAEDAEVIQGGTLGLGDALGVISVSG